MINQIFALKQSDKFATQVELCTAKKQKYVKDAITIFKTI